MKQISPCANCTRVPDPELCENKRCKPWQAWFLRSWQATCKRLDATCNGSREGL